MASPAYSHRSSVMNVPTPASDTSSSVRTVVAVPTTTTTGTKEGTGRNPKRRSESLSSAAGVEPTNRRKASKVSRACDYCKTKKLRCSGTVPCALCVKKGTACQYDAAYRRGRPPTPPVATVWHGSSSTPAPTTGARSPVSPRASFASSAKTTSNHAQPAAGARISKTAEPGNKWNTPSARASPGIGTAEIEGQIVDHTSNLTFIHRAWKRLAVQGHGGLIPKLGSGAEASQPLVSAGDRPFCVTENIAGRGGVSDGTVMFLDQDAAVALFGYYFEHCVVTYRMINQQHCLGWLYTMIQSAHDGLPLETDVGHARAAIVVCILAIASLRQHKASLAPSSPSSSSAAAIGEDVYALQLSEQYFKCSLGLTAAETGLPKLESVQSRTLQVLYLLQSSRMNQAWYAFGGTVPIVSALGLHRKANRHRGATGGSRTPVMDYISAESRKRTFWSVYIIDKYLAVVFGRPRFYHEEDIDQEYPQKVNDEDMTPQGPAPTPPKMDCHIDALIFHARIAQIIDNISREVYSLRQASSNSRFLAAQKFTQELHEWREALPFHLGAVRPSSLIPSFSRQATCLRLAYDHAIMHANRPFLLDRPKGVDAAVLKSCVEQCIGAARDALETIDAMFPDRVVAFHSLWWTPYLIFCALAVVYVWEIQLRAGGDASDTVDEDPSLLALAEKCQCHLSNAVTSDSAGRRYGIIIEELRLEARHHLSHGSGSGSSATHASLGAAAGQQQHLDLTGEGHAEDGLGSLTNDLDSMCDEGGFSNMFNPMSQWQAADWLEIDSSAFGLFAEFEASPVMPMMANDF